MVYAHLQSYPLEILEYITLLIDRPTDLLALALTSKQLCALIIPDQLYFRHLRCDLGRVNLWRVLVERPALAARFHILEIIWEDAKTNVDAPVPRVPPSMDSKSEHEAVRTSKLKDSGHCFKLLAEAIRGMSRLTAFHWLSRSEPADNTIYAALVEACPNLDDVEILFHNRKDRGIVSIDLANAPLWRLSNLTHFSFSEFDIQHDTIPVYTAYTSALAALLLASPNLVDLQIYQNHGFYWYQRPCRPEGPIHDLFAVATWPQLTRLSVESFALEHSYERFFKAYPRLERLCIRYAGSHEIFFADLPCLKSLDIDWLLHKDEIAPEVLEGLQYLSVHFPGHCNLIMGQNHKDFGEILKEATGLKSLLLQSALYVREWMIPVLRSVPMLEKLGLFWDSDGGQSGDFMETQILLLDSLALLPNLTHLSWIGLDLWNDVDEEEKEDEWNEGDELDEAVKEEDEKEDEGDAVLQNTRPSRLDRAVEALATMAPRLKFVQFSGEIAESEESVEFEESVTVIWVSVRRAQGANGDGSVCGKYEGYDMLDAPVEGGAEGWGSCYYASGKGMLDKQVESEWNGAGDIYIYI